MFIPFIFIVTNIAAEPEIVEEVLNFFDLDESLQSIFEEFPLVSTEERDSQYCENATEVVEIRLVDGKQYEKIMIEDDTTEYLIKDEFSGAMKRIILRPRLNCYDQDEKELADLVKDSLFHHPDPDRGYNITNVYNTFPEELYKEIKDSEEDLVNAVLDKISKDWRDLSYPMYEEFFKDVKNGFFIEAGASAGLDDSHTLLFESKLNWTGLLIEPCVNNLQFLNRKAPHVFTCLATKDHPHYVNFENTLTQLDDLDLQIMAGIVHEKTNTTYPRQCIPLYTLLLAAGNPTVHWFILDIEGAEFQVLQTIPWTQVDIEMISVETDLAGLVMEGSREEIIDYMRRQGYIHQNHKNIGNSIFEDTVKDDLFIREDVAKRYGLLVNEKSEL